MIITQNRIGLGKIYTWVYIFDKNYMSLPKIFFLIRLRLYGFICKYSAISF